MICIADDPPAPGDPIALWMGVEDLDLPRAWTMGRVTRVQEGAGPNGEPGVALELSDPLAEAIWCLVPRGDEDEVTLPRKMPRFPEHKARETVKESTVPNLLLESLRRPPLVERRAVEVTQPKPAIDKKHSTQRVEPILEPSRGLESIPTAKLDKVKPSQATEASSKDASDDTQKAADTTQATKKVSTTYSQHQQPRIRRKKKTEPASKPQPEKEPADGERERRSVRPLDAKPSRSTKRMTKAKRAKAPVVGIDFGTTYSKVALFENGEVTLIDDRSSSSSTRASVPSVVAYRPDGTVLVGERAQELLAVDPSTVISSVKRVMGLSFSDPLANGLLASLSCPTVKGPNDTILFNMHGNLVTVPEVASRVLGHLRSMASEWVDADVTEAVFTHPVDFDRKAKKEFELAARMAGLTVKGLVPEPVAAAMGCGYDGSDKAYIAVYDFGGGTFDASIVEVGQERFVVRGAAGDRWLGGDDFDELMARHVADEFHKKTGVVLRNRVEEWQRLLFACEEAKRWLSTLDSVDVVLPRAARTPDGPQTLLVPVSRATFEDLVEDIVTSSVEVCHQATRQAGIDPTEVDSLLITGGSSRIPVVRDTASRLFKKTPAVGVHPQHAVVIGAAVRAAVLSEADVPQDYVERLRGQETVGLTVGLALAGGMTEHIIERTERPPVAAHRLYSTSRDDQTTIRIELVQGDSKRTKENRRVGGFVIDGLPLEKAGKISLDVYFELTTTGTLHVTAQERSTGQRAHGVFDLD
jgi:molecular chaperone DnaK